jgi:hypothetical protein
MMGEKELVSGWAQKITYKFVQHEQMKRLPDLSPTITPGRRGDRN